MSSRKTTKMSEELSDVETLDAVVAFIDDFYEADAPLIEGFSSSSEDAVPNATSSSGGDADASSEATASPPQTTTTRRRPAKAPKRQNHNRARDQRKEELSLLRQEEEALRVRLLQLVMAKATGEFERQRSVEETDTRPEALRQEMLAVWKDMAMRQYGRRKTAETENTRLRDQVQSQRKVIQSLQSILVRHEKPQLAPTPNWLAYTAGSDSVHRTRVFVELLTDLKQAHSVTNAWLDSSRANPLTGGKFDDTRVATLSPTQHALEMIYARLLPIDFRTAADTYWHTGINEHCQMFDIYREHAKVEGRDTVLYSQIVHDGDKSTVRLHTHVSVQKFEEENRIILLIAARPEAIHIDGERVTDVTMTEQYWVVFQAPEGKPQNACLMLSFGRANFKLDAAVASATHAVSTLSTHVHERISGHLNSAVECMEDRILSK
ncbi:hypothetical protein Poli38472_007566 [Pythium oligandrum]|uniref:Uncharacterized protein n=1 Tax=Pythium oligandrum TaxID=41045 RepID=A0A8K1CRG2_PYTOL|nr:hypothetical protein Poli38472_007566 [Pythium oligandrum]|eukprot:TMW67894.1 hypothetical protein Poli38472_007566 [Pythium oligandrum]